MKLTRKRYLTGEACTRGTGSNKQRRSRARARKLSGGRHFQARVSQ